MGDSSTDSLHDKLNMGGSLVSEAVTTLLNACFLGWGVGSDTKIHPIDIINLYLVSEGTPVTKVAGGTIVRPSDDVLKAFFEQTHD
jgi:hypothetical protein